MTELNYKDFRIGNLVKFDGRIFEIDSISKEFPTLNTNEFGIGVVTWNNIEAVPLTEEMLRFDFFFTKINDEDAYYLSIAETEMEIDFELFASGLVCSISSNNGFIVPVDVEYAHQLQNLYWCLCGEELKYNLH